MSTRQYARLLSEWIASIGLDPHLFGTHSLSRTKATIIYRRTGNLRSVQLLLGHTKIGSTVRYLGIEVDDALFIAPRQAEVKSQSDFNDIGVRSFVPNGAPSLSMASRAKFLIETYGVRIGAAHVAGDAVEKKA
jgi:Phage integrase family